MQVINNPQYVIISPRNVISIPQCVIFITQFVIVRTEKTCQQRVLTNWKDLKGLKKETTTGEYQSSKCYS